VFETAGIGVILIGCPAACLFRKVGKWETHDGKQ